MTTRMGVENMLRYQVRVTDFGVVYTSQHRLIGGLSIRKAWKIVHRAARRGVKLYGGTLKLDNWGMRGGRFPQSYRSAVILLDV